MKATQVGISEWLIVNAIVKAAMYGRNVFYVLPTDLMKGQYVHERFDKSLVYTPIYQHLKARSIESSTDSTSIKIFGRGSIIFVASNSAVGFSSHPATDAIVDELDLCDQGNLAMVDNRLSNCPDPTRINVANPTLKGFGIDYEYGRTDKKHWFIRCECGEWVNPDFFVHVVREEQPGSFVVADPDYDPESDQDCGVICHKCGRRLERFSEGRWEAQAVSSRSGYQISKLFSTQVTVKGMLDRFTEGLKNETKMQAFYNADLGLPYTASGAKISFEMMDKCKRDYSMLRESSEPCTIGIDVGSVLHTVISQRTADGKKRVVWFGELHTEEDVIEVWKRFNCRAGVIDAMPEMKMSKRLAALLRGMFICFYSKSAKHDTANSDYKSVTVDRTVLLDSVKEDFLMENILLPQDADRRAPLDSNGYSSYYNHINNSTRTFDEDKKTYNWVEGSLPDHFLHATAYMILANKLMAQI